MATKHMPIRRGVQRLLTLSADVDAQLVKMASGPHGLGDVVERLVVMEVARQEERQRLAESACQGCGGGGKP